ncbi:hypothetical protein VTK56DRAFT_5500 [Thermocarpiscus australiensis]
MWVSVRPFIVLAAFATAYAADYSDNGTTALQILSFLDQLEVSVLNALATQTNSTVSHQNSEEEGAGLRAVNHVLEYAGMSTQLCNYSLPNTSSSLATLEQVILVVRAGTLLASAQSLYSLDSSILSTLAAASIVRSLQGNSPLPVTSRISKRVPFVAPMTAKWAYSLLAHFLSFESCPWEPTLWRTPELRMTPENGTAVNLTWQAVAGESHSDPLFVGWVSWLREPIYTPITITSRNSGVTPIPSGLKGFVVVVMTNKISDNIYDLSADTLSGPVMAEVVI